MIKTLFNIFKLNPNYTNRVFGIDLLRAIAITHVLIGHGGFLLKEANTDFPWVGLISGVNLFFVLSGFLIGRIIIKSFIINPNFGIKDVFNFWTRRWFRTLPNYYLILILNIIIVYFGVIKGDFSQVNWKFFFFLQNFTQPFYDFFWESWSLCVQEWFYISFPAVLIILYFVLRKFKINKKSIFLLTAFIFILTPFLLRFFFFFKFDVDSFWLGVRVYKVVIYRMDAIALGLLGAFVKHYYPKIWFKSRNIACIAGLILCYVILYSTWLPNDFSTKVYKISLQSFGCLLLLPKFDSIKTAPRLLTRVVTHISFISYSLYLINSALVAEVISHNFFPHGTKTSWFMYGIYWFVVITVSTLLYKYYEKPMTDLRDKMP
jgi:peptidoglycan/LPS O-acetylase OafA/YrhL